MYHTVGGLRVHFYHGQLNDYFCPIIDRSRRSKVAGMKDEKKEVPIS